MPLGVRTGVTVEYDRLSAPAHDHPRYFVVIGRRAGRGIALKILNGPAGAHAFHQFSYEASIETDLEVRIPQTFVLEPKGKGSDFAMARHDRPKATDRPSK